MHGDQLKVDTDHIYQETEGLHNRAKPFLTKFDMGNLLKIFCKITIRHNSKFTKNTRFFSTK